MPEIQLPRPDNMDGRFGPFVTNDLFNIAERIQEIDKRLFVQRLDPPVTFGEDTWNYAIVEYCADRVERLVYRCEKLDGRVPEYLRYLLAVPFEQRFAEAEKLEQKHKADADEYALDKLAEEMGGPMRYWLDRCGFATRPESYAKTNPTARRSRAAERLRRLSIESEAA